MASKRGVRKKPYVLVTAGGTFARIDKMRVMANLSEGDTGFLIAKQFAARGWHVVLLISRIGYYKFRHEVPENITLVPYLFFEEYVSGLEHIVAKYGQPSYAISAAAVSDFGHQGKVTGKIPSNPQGLKMELPTLPKVLDRWHDLLGPACVKVGFKLLSMDDSAPTQLFTAAWRQNSRARLQFTVANFLEEYVGGQHPVWIVDPEGRICRVIGTHDEMTDGLVSGLLSEPKPFVFEDPTVWISPRRSATVRLRCYRTNRVLLCRRASRSYNNLWCSPGGGEEVGDIDLLDTAIRECREEVGIDLTAYRGRFKTPVVNFTETEVEGIDRYGEVTDFPLEVGGEFVPTVDSREIAEARWVTTREAAQLSMGPATRAMLVRTWRGFATALSRS